VKRPHKGTAYSTSGEKNGKKSTLMDLRMQITKIKPWDIESGEGESSEISFGEHKKQIKVIYSTPTGILVANDRQFNTFCLE
jgi:hypothetical protein